MKGFLAAILVIWAMYGLIALPQISLAQEQSLPPLQVTLEADEDYPQEVRFWVEWSDGQRLVTEKHFMFRGYFMIEGYLVVVSRYNVVMYNLHQPGKLQTVEMDFADIGDADSRFFIFDADKAIIGQYVFHPGTAESPTYSIQLYLYQVTNTGVEQIIAEAPPCEITDTCED
jgi:hypothetical protein